MHGGLAGPASRLLAHQAPGGGGSAAPSLKSSQPLAVVRLKYRTGDVHWRGDGNVEMAGVDALARAELLALLRLQPQPPDQSRVDGAG